MTTPAARLLDLGISLPDAPKPVASYIPARQLGNLLWISGQIPFENGLLRNTGTVPGTVGLEDAQECARLCVLNGLAAAAGALGSVDRIKSVVRVGCWVASDAGFTDQPKVANGASDLLVEIFGDAGRHVRAAVGARALPLGAPVEIEFLFEVE